MSSRGEVILILPCESICLALVRPAPGSSCSCITAILSTLIPRPQNSGVWVVAHHNRLDKLQWPRFTNTFSTSSTISLFPFAEFLWTSEYQIYI
ncbi:hypothetical protein F5Y16DRAFT_179575 [Xylariaceae sp. FL0255]|nr:hypothetical protein F5Y16DRAFT_179575 [Xylariaceae sp. FL0255]